jgi:hypothetical protein
MVYPVRARPPGPGAQGPFPKGLAIFAPYNRVPAAEPLQEQRAVIYRATVKCDIRNQASDVRFKPKPKDLSHWQRRVPGQGARERTISMRLNTRNTNAVSRKYIMGHTCGTSARGMVGRKTSDRG